MAARCTISPTITGFAAGDIIALDDLTFATNDYDVWTQVADGGTLAIYNGATLLETFNFAGTCSQNQFALTQGSCGGEAALNCFVASRFAGQEELAGDRRGRGGRPVGPARDVALCVD
jgi:hypothetical protein